MIISTLESVKEWKEKKLEKSKINKLYCENEWRTHTCELMKW
jgi:hypothetical protein